MLLKKDFELKNDFPQIYKDGGFDFVIGNPPFQNLKKDIDYDSKNKIYRVVSNGVVNSATLMIAKSIELLKENGYLAFVLPKNILRVDTFANLRKFLLKNTTIVSITDLDEKIKVGSPDAVTKISKITMKGTSEKDLYIFATKYCFMANPKMYFIYDPIVHKQLIRYLNLPLEESTRLNEYEFFASKMQELIKQYKIKASHIDLDTFLWIEGHEEFSHKIF